MADGLTGFDAKAFGRRLRAQRELLGFTEEYVAQQLKMELESYKQLERGNNNPSFEKLFKLRSILRVSIDYLVDGDCKDQDERRRIIIENMHGCFSVCSNFHLECMSVMVQYYVKSIVGEGPSEE